MSQVSQKLPHIDLAIHSDNWQSSGKAEKLLCKLSEKAILTSATTADLQWFETAELSIVFTDDAEMTKINGEWRKLEKPTNVLSFPGDDIQIGDPAGQVIGDIIFAFETIEREANEQNKSFENHLTHLMVHGFLHLFGYDHIEDGEAEIMESLETKILTTLNIADPYN